MASKYICMWLVIFCFPCHGAGKSKCKFYQENCYNLSSEEQTSTLTCRSGSVLFAPSVKASLTSSGDCAGNTNCTGYQVNGLVLSNNCFWQRSCDIQYSRSSVIIMAEDSSCLGKLPHIVKTRFSCVKSGEVFTVGNRSRSRPITKKQGIVKSHEDFPWDFEREMSGSLVLKTNKPNRKLVITAYKADVDWEYDNITIAGENGIIPITTEAANLGEISGSEIRLTFRFSRHSRMVAEGFVFCFKWFKKNKRIRRYDVCKQIQVCPRKRKNHRNNRHPKLRRPRFSSRSRR